MPHPAGARRALVPAPAAPTARVALFASPAGMAASAPEATGAFRCGPTGRWRGWGSRGRAVPSGPYAASGCTRYVLWFRGRMAHPLTWPWLTMHGAARWPVRPRRRDSATGRHTRRARYTRGARRPVQGARRASRATALLAGPASARAKRSRGSRLRAEPRKRRSVREDIERLRPQAETGDGRLQRGRGQGQEAAEGHRQARRAHRLHPGQARRAQRHRGRDGPRPVPLGRHAGRGQADAGRRPREASSTTPPWCARASRPPAGHRPTCPDSGPPGELCRTPPTSGRSWRRTARRRKRRDQEEDHRG